MNKRKQEELKNLKKRTKDLEEAIVILNQHGLDYSNSFALALIETEYENSKEELVCVFLAGK
jgi:hypothetical protein